MAGSVAESVRRGRGLGLSPPAGRAGVWRLGTTSPPRQAVKTNRKYRQMGYSRCRGTTAILR